LHAEKNKIWQGLILLQAPQAYNFTLGLLPFHGNTERWKQICVEFNEPEKAVYSFCRNWL